MLGYLGCCHAGLTVVDNILAAHEKRLFETLRCRYSRCCSVKGTTEPVTERSRLNGTKWYKEAWLFQRRQAEMVGHLRQTKQDIGI